MLRCSGGAGFVQLPAQARRIVRTREVGSEDNRCHPPGKLVACAHIGRADALDQEFGEDARQTVLEGIAGRFIVDEGNCVGLTN